MALWWPWGGLGVALGGLRRLASISAFCFLLSNLPDSFPTCPVRWHMSPLCWRRDQSKPKRRLPPELVVRRPGVSPPPPANLPSKRWRDLTCLAVALAKADPPRLACWPPPV